MAEPSSAASTDALQRDPETASPAAADDELEAARAVSLARAKSLSGGGSEVSQLDAKHMTHLVASIAKVFVGSGVLFLPRAFQNGGWLFSICAMVLFAWLTCLCILKLLECRELMPRGSTYGDIGRRAMGTFGAVAVDVCVVLVQASAACVYVSFVAKNILQLLNSGSCWVGGNWLWLLVLLQLPILAPLTWVRRLSRFGAANVFADCAILITLIAILAFSISGMATNPGPGSGPLRPTLPLVTDNWSLMLGTAVFSFEGVGVVVPLANTLRGEARRAFPKVLTWTMVGVTFTYVALGAIPMVAVVGYMAQPLEDTITLNLPSVWWKYVCVAAYCIALIISYAVMMHPAVRVLETAALPLLFRAEHRAARRRAKEAIMLEAAQRPASVRLRTDTAAQDPDVDFPTDEAERLGDDFIANESVDLLLAATSGRHSPAAKWTKNAFRTLLVIITMVVAYAGSSQLDNFVSLVGSLCCTPIAFIFPAAFHAIMLKDPQPASDGSSGGESSVSQSGDGTRKGHPGLTKWQLAGDWIIVVGGIAIAIYTAYQSIATWSAGSTSPCPPNTAPE